MSAAVLIAGAFFGFAKWVDTAHAADIGIATLTSVINTEVGTGQTGEDATHILNNNIVKYSANYTFTTPGAVTVTATLPAGNTWATATVSTANGCGAGSNINSDGNVATCVLSNANAGMASWSLAATVYGANSDTIQPVFTDTAGASSVKPKAIAIVAKPNYNLVFGNAGVNTIVAPAADSGLTGLNISSSYVLMAPWQSAGGVLGLEPLANGGFSFQLDTSSLPSGWTLVGCDGNYYYGKASDAWPNYQGANSNGVTDGGTATCTVSPDGNTLTIAKTGAYTGGTKIPTRGTGLSYLLPDAAYYAVNSITINVPFSSLASMPTNYTLAPVADSLTATGAGGAANTGTISGSYTYRLSSEVQYYYRVHRYQDVVGWFNTWTAGQPVYAGQNYRWAAGPRIDGPAGWEVKNPYGCQTIDPNSVSLVEVVKDPTIAAAYPDYAIDIEYGVLSGTPQEQTAQCGTVGDGATGWYSSQAAAEAAGQISAVRFRLNGTLKSSDGVGGVDGTTSFVWLRLHVNDDIASSSRISGYAVAGSDDTDSPRVAGESWQIAVNSIVGNSIAVSNTTANSPTIPAGGTETITITPTVTGATGGKALDTTATVTIPANLNFVAGSAQFGGAAILDPTIATNGDGTKTLTFALGDLAVGQTDKLVFQTNVAVSTIMPAQATVISVISSSDSTDASVAQRTASRTFDITAPATFGVTKSQSAMVLQPGMSQTYDFAIYNTTPSDVTGITEIDVLPYNGDSRGTTGLTSYSVDAFAGSAGLTLSYTTDTAIRSDIGAAVVWTTYTGGTLPSGIAAVRWQLTNLASNGSASVSLTLANITANNGAIVGNTISRVVSSMGTLSDASKVTATYRKATVSGFVYRDTDISGDYTSAADSALANLTVNLLQNNNIVATTTTDSSGKYSFANLASGDYKVSLAQNPANLVSNLDKESDFTLATGVDSTNHNFGFVAPILAKDDSAKKTVAANDGTNEPLPIGALANDVGANGEDNAGLTISTAPFISANDNCAAPTLGVVEIANGKISYVANPGAHGIDEFCYEIADNFGQKSFAKITITLNLPEFIVNFDTEGGTVIATQTVVDQQFAIKPETDPARANYRFAGWFADENLTTEFDFATLIVADTTIFGGWEKLCEYNPDILASDATCVAPPEPTPPVIPSAPNTGIQHSELLAPYGFFVIFSRLYLVL